MKELMKPFEIPNMTKHQLANELVSLNACETMREYFSGKTLKQAFNRAGSYHVKWLLRRKLGLCIFSAKPSFKENRRWGGKTRYLKMIRDVQNAPTDAAEKRAIRKYYKVV